MTEISITKKQYLTDLYCEFKEKSKEYIPDCEILPPVDKLDLYDLLYYFGIYFHHEKYYQDSFNALLILFDIDLPDSKYVEAYKILIEFVNKIKEVK